MSKVFQFPNAATAGVGGMARVCEGLERSLPAFGYDFTDRAADADIILFHAALPNDLIRMYPEKAFIQVNHGWYWAEYEWGGKWFFDTNQQVMEGIRCADAVITPSEWVARIIERHTCRKPAVIPHGLDGDWNTTKDLGYVLWDKTRVDPICDPAAVNQLAMAMPDVQFVTTFGLPAPNVTVVGQVDFEKAKGLVEGASVYLVTTRETFGIATIQALAAAVPVVGFNIGAQPEILTHGVDSWLVRRGDIEGLSEGVRWALANRAKLGPVCQETAAKYTWEAAAAEYAKVFSHVLESRDEQAGRGYPRTSVIVPSYNLAKYLPDCLTSVLDQNDEDWECIIVDDASTDGSLAIAKSYEKKDKRFRVIANKKNVYLAEARNIGIRAARGKYIMPLDADDMLTSRSLETLAHALDVDRHIHIAYGGMLFVEEDGFTPRHYGNGTGHSGWPIPFKFETQIAPPGPGQRPANCLPYCSMYRREVWQLTGGYRPRLKLAEDADFWVRASSYGFRPAMVTKADTAIYREREGSMSSKKTPPDWTAWFPWSKNPTRSPAGAVTSEGQLPSPTYEPPAVSVIIPVGPGHASIVRDAVDSVDAQTYRHWECIVVNDTGKGLAELPSWVRIIDTRGPKGTGAARNLGIQAARATYVLPLDADDYLQPQALEIFVAAALRRPDTVLYSDFWHDQDIPGVFTRYETPDFDCKDILNRATVAVTQFIPRSVWAKVGGYPEEGGWEDWRFQIRCATSGVCSAKISAPLFTYRKWSGRRASTDKRQSAALLAKVKEEWADYYNGRKQVGCGCKGTQGESIIVSQAFRAAASTPQGGPGMEQITYDGDHVSRIKWRGPVSKQPYFFSKGETKWVRDEDVAELITYPGFARAVAGETASDDPTLISDAPAGVEAVHIATADPWADIPAAVKKLLAGAGYDTGDKVSAATDEQLAAVKGLGPSTVQKLRVAFPALVTA